MKKIYRNAPAEHSSNVLSVLGLGIHERMRAAYHVDRPAGTSTFLFMHFHDAVEVFFDGHVRTVPARTTVIWEPHQKHYFGHSRRAWDHSWMLSSGNTLVRLLKSSGLPLNRPLNANCEALMMKYLRAIYDELSRYADPDMVILEGIFTLLIRELARAAKPNHGTPAVPESLRELLQVIESDVSRPWRLEEMAQRVHLSVSHFSATFRRHFSMAPVEYVLRLKMKHAAWLLEDRSLAVSQAAYAAGFRDPLYFSKAFRKHYGKSPRAYRASRS